MEKIATSISSLTRSSQTAGQLLGNTLGYQQLVPVGEELKTPHDFTEGVTELAEREYRMQTRKSRGEPIRRNRDYMRLPQDEGQENIDYYENVTMADESQPLEQQQDHQNEAQQEQRLEEPVLQVQNNGMPPPPIEQQLESARPLPDWLNPELVLADENAEQRNYLRPLWDRFVTALVVAIPAYAEHEHTVKQAYDLFKEYVATIKDKDDEKKLTTIAQTVFEYSNEELEDYIANNSIHRECHWELKYDRFGQLKAKIVCNFKNQKIKTFQIR